MVAGTEPAEQGAQVADGGHGLDRRPPDTSDATVEAVGKLSEALETIEEVRGRLYGLHRLTGSADLALGEACELLRKAGHPALADQLEEQLVGRNVIAGRWTFQVVEEFDDGYYADFRRLERAVRDELMQGRRHVFEAEMKAERRSPGRVGHEATPEDVPEATPEDVPEAASEAAPEDVR